MNELRLRIAHIKATVSVPNLFERDGHKLARTSGGFKTLCPFHREKTPSFYITENHYHCFGCGQHGDAVDYVRWRDGVSIVKAVELLSGSLPARFDRPSPVEMPTQEPELPESYFEEKMNRWANQTHPEEIVTFGDSIGVDGGCMLALDVAWSDDHNAWAIPMRNSDNRIVGIRLRDSAGKKWAVKGSKQGLFIPNVEPRFDMVVTEGPTDCAAALSMGLYAIGKAMAMMASDEVLKFIKTRRIRRVIIVADNDQSGLKGAQKLIDACPVPTCEIVLPTKDLRKFAQMGGSRQLFDVMLANQNWRRKTK